MKDIPKIVLFALGMPHLILSGCPDYKSLGPRTDNDKSMCACMYQDETTDINTSCGGAELQVANGETANSVPLGWNDFVSSMIVREGCTLTGYKDGNLGGKHKDFTGIHYYLSHEHDHSRFNWNDKISSYICKCLFEPVDCIPVDNWDMIFSCNNKLGDDEITCKYTESHGITVGHGFTNGHGYSETISAEIGMRYASVGGSLTTGYSWSESEEFSTTMTEGFEVDFTVPAGSHRGAYQIQGKCGDSITKTTCFEVRDMDTKMILSTTCPDLYK
ncbi:unnamed protein product [Meganyctiphanes norvegica]|uniref:Uncharacterized protein n=1 Tax=Meganyctiphanes norvegica TaxID=48144 RepID=A0AAV2RXV7_MEGNR